MSPAALLLALLLPQGEDVNPFPRPIIREEPVVRWDFDRGDDGWTAVHDAKVAARDGRLVVDATGDDPYLHGPELAAKGPLVVRLSARLLVRGHGQVFWVTRQSPVWDEAKSARFVLDGEDRERVFAVELPTRDDVTQLRIDPRSAPGKTVIDWIEVGRVERHPLAIARVKAERDRVLATVKNHGVVPVAGRLNGQRFELAAGATRAVAVPLAGKPTLERMDLVAECDGLPPVTRAVTILHEEIETDWITQTKGTTRLQVAPDASCARLLDGDVIVAWLAPLAARDGRPLTGQAALEKGSFKLEGTGWGTQLYLSPGKDGHLLVVFALRADLEGPILRMPGALRHAVLPGVEFLGPGERSSSRLDIETAEHVRYAPDPVQVTAPYMAAVTERGGVAVAWNDHAAQPRLATPDFVDGTPDLRMSVQGRGEGRILFGRDLDLPALIVRAVGEVFALTKEPKLPYPPRQPADQVRLNQGAFDGPLRDATGNGWGHCAEANWPRAWYADHVSAIFRLTGAAPRVPQLVPGGGHIRDDAAWFVTHRAREWLALRSNDARAVIAEQKADGSFRYDGPMRRGWTEDTANGYCAVKALVLLEHARLTGDAAARAAGLRALEFVKRLDVPRGAQTWEIPLHTPDLLAAAYLVACHVQAFELTGDAAWLDEANRQAILGLPFVYLWGDRPAMTFATIPVFGATHARAPVWIGLPVQWCGLNYAHALLELARHARARPDQFPLADEPPPGWEAIAQGILHTAERMQLAVGPFAGCLPDSFDLAAQRGSGPMINPSAIVRVRALLQREPNGVYAAANERHRVIAPFPVAFDGDRATIAARPGVRYQVLVDNARTIDVTSAGTDRIDFASR